MQPDQKEKKISVASESPEKKINSVELCNKSFSKGFAGHVSDCHLKRIVAFNKALSGIGVFNILRQKIPNMLNLDDLIKKLKNSKLYGWISLPTDIQSVTNDLKFEGPYLTIFRRIFPRVIKGIKVLKMNL